MTLLKIDNKLIDVNQSLIAYDKLWCPKSLVTFIKRAWKVV